MTMEPGRLELRPVKPSRDEIRAAVESAALRRVASVVALGLTVDRNATSELVLRFGDLSDRLYAFVVEGKSKESVEDDLRLLAALLERGISEGPAETEPPDLWLMSACRGRRKLERGEPIHGPHLALLANVSPQAVTQAERIRKSELERAPNP